MSNYEKVFVTITDEDGTTHRIVGYRDPTLPTTVYQTRDTADAWAMTVLKNAQVKLEVVRELPTGFGAVVLLDGLHWAYVGNDTWVDEESSTDMLSEDMREEAFEVISEGVEI